MLNPIQIYVESLILPAHQIERLFGHLSPDEQVRTGRFHQQRDHDRFIVTRGILREILGDQLGIAPEALRFQYGPYAKPELAPPFAESGMCFNLSHTDGLAAYALAYRRTIGIDIERIHMTDDLNLVIDQYFTVREQAALNGLPPEQRARAFFACWTCKEAYSKARGDGLARPLEQIEITEMTDHSPAILNDAADPQAARNWELRQIEPAPGYIGALAAEGPIGELLWRNRGGAATEGRPNG